MLYPNILIFSQLAFVSAIPWQGAIRTASAIASLTEPPPLPTSSIEQDLARLHRRDSYPVSVCGWIGGDGGLPAYCSEHSSCVWNTDNHFVGCCATASEACRFYTSCVDRNSRIPDAIHFDVYTCHGSALCYLNSYWDDFSQFGCGNPDDATTVMSSYKGINTQLSLHIVYTGDDAPTDTAMTSLSVFSTGNSKPHSDSSESKTTNTGRPNSSAAGQQKETATSTTTPKSTSPSSNLHGAIIGGTIGGVAGFCMVLALCFLYYRRSRRDPRQSYLYTPTNSGNGMRSSELRTASPSMASPSMISSAKENRYSSPWLGAGYPAEIDGNGISELPGTEVSSR